MMERLTQTKRRDFKTCQRYYWLRHEKRLELRAQRRGRRRGTAFGMALFAAHAAQQAGEDPIASIAPALEDAYDVAYNQVGSDEEAQALDLEVCKVKVMAEAYIRRHGVDRRREVTFDLPLRSPVTGHAMRAFRRAGKIDGVVVRSNHECELIEDKFVQQITPVRIERIGLDEQVLEYVDALAEVGWHAVVRYRHTRYPSINPAGPKQYKTKEDYPGETLDEFEERLRGDVDDRPDFYFDEQIVWVDETVLHQHRMERWTTARDILAKRAEERRVGEVVWVKNTSRCLDWGGCMFLPICEGRHDAADLYVTVDDNVELIRDEKEGDGGEA